MSAKTARPESWSASRRILPRASARSIWSRSLPRRSAARAAAGGPTWRRPAVPTAPRRGRRCRRSKKPWAPEANHRLFLIQKRRDHFARLLARHHGDDLEGHAEPLAIQDPLLNQPDVVAFHQL